MMEPTADELIAEMQQQFPREVRIAVLTIVNRKQGEEIRRMETQAKFWEDDALSGKGKTK